MALRPSRHPTHSSAGSIQVGNYLLEIAERRLRGDRGEAPLSPLVARFLERLAAAKGATVGRADLIDDLWAGNYHVGESALNRTVSEARKAAKAAGSSPLIETVQKNGYRLYRTESVESVIGPNNRRTVLWSAILIIVTAIAALLIMDAAMGLIWSYRHANYYSIFFAFWRQG